MVINESFKSYIKNIQDDLSTERKNLLTKCDNLMRKYRNNELSKERVISDIENLVSKMGNVHAIQKFDKTINMLGYPFNEEKFNSCIEGWKKRYLKQFANSDIALDYDDIEIPDGIYSVGYRVPREKEQEKPSVESQEELEAEENELVR